MGSSGLRNGRYRSCKNDTKCRKTIHVLRELPVSRVQPTVPLLNMGTRDLLRSAAAVIGEREEPPINGAAEAALYKRISTEHSVLRTKLPTQRPLQYHRGAVDVPKRSTR